MIKTLIVILICSCTLNAYAQIAMKDSTVNVVAYWEKGEKEQYKYTYQKLSIKDNDTTYSHYITYDIIITILKENKSSYSLKWEYKNGINTDYNLPIPLSRELRDNKTYYYQTNEMGSFDKLQHWNKIQKENGKQFQSLDNHSNYNDPNTQKIYENIKKIMTDRVQFELTQIPDIQLMHYPYGIKLKLNEEQVTDFTMDNVLNKQKPLKMQYKIMLDYIDTIHNYYILNAVQSIDQEDLKKFVEEFAFKYENTTENNYKQLLENINKKIESQHIIHNTGWLIHGYQKIETQYGQIKTIEEKTIINNTKEE